MQLTAYYAGLDCIEALVADTEALAEFVKNIEKSYETAGRTKEERLRDIRELYYGVLTFTREVEFEKMLSAALTIGTSEE